MFSAKSSSFINFLLLFVGVLVFIIQFISPMISKGDGQLCFNWQLVIVVIVD